MSAAITQTSTQGELQLIGEEGEALRAYKCPAGFWTIGVGLTKASGVVDPKAGMEITPAESRQLLRLALARNYEPRVLKFLKPQTQHEMDGGVLWDFNTGRIHNASWVGMYLQKAFALAETSFKSWVKAGGRTLAGLVARREREWRLLRDGIYTLTPAKATSNAISNPADIYADLQKLGYDGQGSPLTAVKRFQAANDLKVDGIVGPATRATLRRALDARAQKSTTGIGAGGGAVAGGGGDAANTQNIDLDTILAAGLTALIIAALVFGAWMIWRNRGPLFAWLPEPVKDFFQHFGIAVGRRQPT